MNPGSSAIGILDETSKTKDKFSEVLRLGLKLWAWSLCLGTKVVRGCRGVLRVCGGTALLSRFNSILS